MQGVVAGPDQAVWLAGILIANFGSLMAAYVSIKVSLARLELKVDRNEKDIDNLGFILGTERAKAQKKEA
jgi:hypothetical protein